MQKFSNRLISLRKERSLTQEDLAKIIHKKRSTVSGYETEGKEPDLETVCFLAKYFGVSTDYLLGHSDERNHVEQVFYNDTVNFERHFKNMPAELRPVVSKCFDSFYLLLGRDMQLARPERLRVYEELLHTLQSQRPIFARLSKPPAVPLLTLWPFLTSWLCRPSSKMLLPLCSISSCRPIWKLRLTSRKTKKQGS